MLHMMRKQKIKIHFKIQKYSAYREYDEFKELVYWQDHMGNLEEYKYIDQTKCGEYGDGIAIFIYLFYKNLNIHNGFMNIIHK